MRLFAFKSRNRSLDAARFESSREKPAPRSSRVRALRKTNRAARLARFQFLPGIRK